MIEQRGKGIPLSNGSKHGRTLLAFVFSVCFLLLAFAESSQAKPWRLQDKLRMQVLYEIGYDNNYLELSDRDIDRFKDGELGLVTKVESYDALVQNAGIKFRLATPKIFGWRNGSLSYTISYHSYLQNNFNDRATHSLYFSHDLFNRMDIFGSHLYIPNRYLRDYYDRDYGAVYATEFGYRLSGVGIRVSPKFLPGISLAARYEDYSIFYNPRFTEYDTEGWGYRVDLRYRVNSNLSVTGIFKKRFSDNIGFSELDQATTLIEQDAEYGDGSNGEDWFEVVLAWKTPKLLRRAWSVELSTRFRHRYYTSELPLAEDPIHRGREHLHSRYGITVDGPLVGNLRGGPMFDYEMRRTDSPLPWVSETKDFDTWRAGIALTYTLW